MINLCDNCFLIDCKVKNNSREKDVIQCSKNDYVNVEDYEQTKLGV